MRGFAVSLAPVTAETAWQAGNLGMKGGARVLFGHMFEDAEIEREAFRDCRRVFCIASAGCTALRLCDRHEVVACDINPVQLAYAERRVRGGSAESGDADRAMAFARFFSPLVGWSGSLVRAFLALSDTGDQIEFWHAHLDTLPFRTGFDALLSRAVLRLVYSPRLLACVPERFGAVVRGRMERGFGIHPNNSNPFARALLRGEWDRARDVPGPGADRIQFALGDAASYLESCDAGSFDGFTLSNILDGAEASYRERLVRAVRRAASRDAKVVLRSFSEPPPGLKGNRAERDRALLWGVVDVLRADMFC